MKYFIQIFLYFIFIFHPTFEENNNNNEKFLFLNDQSNISYLPYKILTSTNRIRREKSSFLTSNEDLTNQQCDQHIYTKLYSCSRLPDCSALTSCLQSIHCPLNIKSYGSLTLNLLNLFDVKDCDENSSCSFNQRISILKNLLSYWTDQKLTNNLDYLEGYSQNLEIYCETISSFISEVKKEIQNQCSLYINQVDQYLENYLCSSNFPSSQIDWSKLDETLRKISTTSSQINYFDEEEELNFLNFNRNLVNTTEQTVYVNDHQYYNVSYIIPKTPSLPTYFVEDNRRFQPIHALNDKHRSAFSISLNFDFPFYGHSINKILVGTGGFIYTGDLLHSALIGSTQYIAPFMANFDVSIGGNQSEIKYFDNTTHLICTWKNLYLQDQQDAGPFTFQAILQNTGNIYFNYIRIPQVKISSLNHAHRIGLSDAYMSQHSTNEHIIRVITLYDKLNLDKERIHDGVSIVFDMDNTCNTFMDCTSCLANRGKRYNCSWCEDLQKCSDGYDRSRHQWIKAQCHRLALENTCPNHFDSHSFNPYSLSYSSSISPINRLNHFQSSISSYQHTALATFRTIVITLLITVLLLSLLAFIGTYIYAYRNPTSPPGMWLIEHRPSTYIARFKRFTGTNNESN